MSSAPSKQHGTLAAPGVKLSLGHSCYRNLTWDCVLEGRGAATVLVSALPKRGYVETSDSELVRVFDAPEQHSVVVVPRTGRVQIRIHYLTRVEKRADAASQVANALAEALRVPTGSAPM